MVMPMTAQAQGRLNFNWIPKGPRTQIMGCWGPNTSNMIVFGPLLVWVLGPSRDWFRVLGFRLGTAHPVTVDIKGPIKGYIEPYYTLSSSL